MSALSYGASSLGSMFGPVDEADAIRTVHEVLHLGINYIDVSPYYGLTKAETVLGKAIKGIDRSKFLLSTKAGRYGDDVFDFSAERIIRSLEESLGRLQTDYVDILFLHDIEFVPFEQVMEVAIPAVQKLKEQGKIRYYGISGYPISLFEKALDEIKVDFILSYAHYTLNDISLSNLLPLLHEKGVDLVNASPLGLGLLTKQGPPVWHPSTNDIKHYCQKAAQYCSEQGVDIAKLALQFTLSNEQIPTTLVSTTKSEHIRNNVLSLEEPINLEVVSKVREILEPIHNMTWESGRPEYKQGRARG